MPDNTQWEYLTMTLGSFWSAGKEEVIEQRLNEIGEQGWEVINVYSLYNSRKSRVIAKRLLTVSVKRQRSLPNY